MTIAREGIREIAVATLVLWACGAIGGWLYWPLSIPFVAVWLFVVAFFRDPTRVGVYSPGELCSPADGTVTEITPLDSHEVIGGPATRIGIFLSLFNVHINRMPCGGTVRSTTYRKGEFLDARHPESGKRNEANTVVLDTHGELPGPVVVTQVAGLVARRIICHVQAGDSVTIGERFGLIKFGSRTELIVPRLEGTEIVVRLGDGVKAGLTVLVRQRVKPEATSPEGRAKTVPSDGKRVAKG
ncbi:MAG: phosphatidylserine decarboxylase [Planctomycetota bacterium]